MSQLHSSSSSVPAVGLFTLDYQLVYYHARRFGLSVPEAEDCAMDFLRHLWTHDRVSASIALRRCRAHDFACDTYRSNLRRIRRETLLSEITRSDGAFLDIDRPDPHLMPEEVLMRNTFWELLQPCIIALRTDYASLLLGHYVDGLTVRELAEATGRSVGAVEQSLVRALRNLRVLLARAGVEMKDLSYCLPHAEAVP